MTFPKVASRGDLVVAAPGFHVRRTSFLWVWGSGIGPCTRLLSGLPSGLM